MAATLQWQISTAAAATWSTTTKLRFKSANDNTDDLNDPLVKPTAGTNYSFEKALRINVSVAPTTQLSNLRVLLSAAPGTGLTMNYGFDATYSQPVGTDSAKATTTLSTTEIAWANSGNVSVTGQWGDLLYLQLDVGTGAAGGEITDFNVIARYDEI